MRQIIYSRFGDPTEVLDVVEAAPAQPGPGEVAVALEAAPIHLADLKHIRGLPWFDGYPAPQVPGYEGVGRIARVGPDVSGWSAGDRVFLPVRFGVWCEESLAVADELWRAPEHMDAAQLALLPINLTTAWLMLTSVVTLAPGDWVMQNAANSNVGYYLIRLARRLGVKTVNVVRTPERVAELKAAGGDVNLVDGPDLADRVREHIGNQSLRLAFDAVAGDATERLAACLGPAGGTVAVYGVLSGQACAVAPERLLFDDVSVVGFYTARTLEGFDAEQHRDMRQALERYLEEDPPKSAIAGVYPFTRVREAVAHAARTQGDRVGKIILTPDSTEVGQ